MKFLNFSIFFLVLTTFVFNGHIFAQTEAPFEDLPPTSEYGKCYAKCKTPDVYETVTSQRLVKEASTKMVKVPAKYETITEKVLVKEGGKKYRVIPATYKKITDRIEIEPTRTRTVTIPAKYSTQTRQVLVSPATGKWVRKKKYANCFSENADDCYVTCYEEVPAQYRTEKYEVLVAAATTKEEVIPAKYRNVSTMVIDRHASTEEIIVEPEYKTVKRKVLVSAETINEETVPAVYTTVTEKKLKKSGEYTVWTEILCAEKTSSSKISSIQRALKDEGFNPGPIDGVLGSKTKLALIRYQTGKELPIGNLNMQTLKALGVEDNPISGIQ